jgi:hypothetical protein
VSTPSRCVVAALAVALLETTACAHLFYGQCSEPSLEQLSQVPARLSATGLFADLPSESLAEGVVAYRPQFELWTDGAAKRRWVYLPAHTRIDSSDIDAWQFPEGTKFWKEFTRDGIRVETRFLHKVGPEAGDWIGVSYVWSRDGRDAFATPEGLENALGTPHDVPPARNCMGCHGGAPGRVLGFGAIQLAHEASGNEMSLHRLVGENRLTKLPPSALRVPGDARTQQALGYLHANCSHCHNQHRPPTAGPRCFDPREDFDLSLRVDRLSTLEATPVYATAVGTLITPGDADGSSLFQRFDSDSPLRPRMPALGTKTIDGTAAQLLHGWIQEELPAAPISHR